jgi:hypothetical protein
MDASSLVNVRNLDTLIVLGYHGNAEREVRAIWRDDSGFAWRRAWCALARCARLWHRVIPFFPAFGLMEYARPHLANMSVIDIETTPKGEWPARR